MHIQIIRDRSLASPDGEFGRMLLDAARVCFTCEQPWNDNIPNASCIPEGDYQLVPYNSAAHGHTFVFHNPALNIYGTPAMIPSGVAGRSLCEIHVANWPFQLRGCVAVGHRLANMPPHGLGVDSSTSTFAMLMGMVGQGKGLSATIGSE
jgi:hypothetical protein